MLYAAIAFLCILQGLHTGQTPDRRDLGPLPGLGPELPWFIVQAGDRR